MGIQTIRLLVVLGLVVSNSVVLTSTSQALEPIKSGQLVNLYQGGAFKANSDASFAWSDNVIGSASTTDLNVPIGCPSASTGGFVFVSQAGNEMSKTSWQAYSKQSFSAGTTNLLTPNLKLSGLTNGTVSTVKAIGGSWSLGVACTENLDTLVNYVAFRTISVTAGTGAWTSSGALVLTPTPSISGGSTTGSTLTALTSSWDVGASITYQWLRSGSAISGETDSTYVLRAADAGSQVSVRTTGTITGYAAVETISATVSATNATLSTTPIPSVTGGTSVGNTLTALPGTWNAGVALAYQWLRDGANISGATNASYSIQPTDLGHALSVRVTGSLAGYTTVAKTSNSTASIVAAVLTSTPVPTTSGTAKVASTLTAAPGTWDAGVKLAYQWLRDGAIISGATSPTYSTQAADLGRKLTVRVTGSLAGFVTVEKTSAETATIAAGKLAALKVALSGVVKVAKTVTLKVTGASAGATLRYQWLLDGKAIAKATSSKIKLTTKQKGHKLSVRVTETKTGFTTLISTSAAQKIG